MLQGKSNEHNMQLLELQLHSHQDLLNKARNFLKKDMRNVQNKNSVECLTFDV